MKKVQMNLQVPIEVKEYIYGKAETHERHPAYILTKIIEGLMNTAPTPVIAGDAHLQQSLIPAVPKIDKEDGFYDFWNAYPKKKAKADALKAWIKGECHKIRELIIKDVCIRGISDPSWSDKNYVPNGATYLNGKRWDDEIIEQDNRPKFEQQGDALREKMFGKKKGETYDQ